MAGFVGGVLEKLFFIKGLFIVHRFCTQPKIVLVGISHISLEKTSTSGFAIHKFLRFSDTYWLEIAHRVIPKSIKFDNPPRLSREH